MQAQALWAMKDVAYTVPTKRRKMNGIRDLNSGDRDVI